MKKTLLLSVVASTMIMAGGDIAPVEPVVEAPVVAEVSAWNYGGSLVAYTQTTDNYGDGSLFDAESTYASWGVQLGATNADVIGGIGAGVEVAGIVASTGTGAGFYGNGGNAGTTSGGFTQAYLTYGMGNTSLKFGRQTLPKSLSPFAYSEGWQVFKNTFDAALVVNSSLPNTTLVYAFVKNANRSVGEYLNEDSFAALNGSDGVHMFTAQNKSIENLTLTGTYYTATDAIDVLWGEAAYKGAGFSAAVQGGELAPEVGESTSAFGAKIGAKLGMFNLMAAYTTVDEDGSVGVTNLATGIKSPLYTQMVLDNVGQAHAAPGSDFVKVGGSVKAIGGTVKAFYGAGSNDNTNRDYSEFDLMYVTKITENTKLFAAYVYTDQDIALKDSSNFVRFWARYNFK
jgi:hypothetical protein